MGADFYENEDGNRSRHVPRVANSDSEIPLGIGENTTIERAIVDKNAHIGRDVKIINKDHVEESNREDEGFYIRNGIVVVLKNAVIPDGTVI